LRDAGRTIGPENQAKDLGQQVVEHAAVVGVREVGAISTASEPFVNAALPRPTPFRIPSVMTPKAAALQVRAAGTAVQIAVGHEVRISYDLLNGPPPTTRRAGLGRTRPTRPAGRQP
jgi:hypothetical protein